MAKILFVTGNKNKLKEARELLPGHDVEQMDIDLLECQGDALFVVTEKARLAYSMVKRPLFVEDTSVGFHCLNGFPGPYIKALTSSNDISAIPKMLAAFPDKGATGTAMIGYADKTGVKVFKGEIQGTIVAPRGKNGFAWDSIFQPEGMKKTFAEMGIEEKNAISHRMKAFEAFRRFLG